MRRGDLIDVNVYVGHWPFRDVRGNARELAEMFKRNGVREAWAASFEGLFHKDIGGVNSRLAEVCERDGRGVLIPIGSVNPMLPDWEADLRQCAEAFGMRGIRLHPNYHGYGLDDPVFAALLRAAAERGLWVQLCVTMEDERMMHPMMRVDHVDVKPLIAVLRTLPPVKAMLLNAFRAVSGDLLAWLVTDTDVLFDISWIEGMAGIERVGVPVERLVFGSFAPMFYWESASLKLEEAGIGKLKFEG